MATNRDHKPLKAQEKIAARVVHTGFQIAMADSLTMTIVDAFDELPEVEASYTFAKSAHTCTNTCIFRINGHQWLRSGMNKFILRRDDEQSLQRHDSPSLGNNLVKKLPTSDEFEDDKDLQC